MPHQCPGFQDTPEELLKNQSAISEYQGGHVKGSINIPLNELPQSLGKLSPTKTIITCCASGMRSSSAKSLLKSKGFQEVHNGGGWQNLDYALR